MSDDYLDMKIAQLLSAAANGSVAKVKAVIDDGVSCTCKDYDDRTALHLAASEGHLDVVKLLVEEGVPLGIEDRWGHTPLNDAIKSGHDEIAAYLHSKGATLNCSGSDAGRELTTAAFEGSLLKVRLLLESGVNVHSVDYNGRTALHFATSAGRTEIVKLLLEHGADVNAPDRWGSTPISDSVQYKHFDLASLMRATCAKLADLDGYKNSEQFASALYQTVILLCEKDNWSYGAGWVVNKSVATASEAWFAPTFEVWRLSEWRQATESTILNIDSSTIIGRVAIGGRPEWSEDCDIETDAMLDPEVMRRTGFKSALVVPILVNSILLAVLEFRSFDLMVLDPANISNLEATASRMIIGHLRQFNGSVSVVRGVFDDQINEVLRLVLLAGIFTESVVRREVDWYYTGLGLHEFYWRQFSPQQISQHVMAFIAAKLQGQTTGTSGVVRYRVEDSDSALYIYPLEEALDVERRIESHWLSEGYQGSKPGSLDNEFGISVKQFLSKGFSTPDCQQKVVIYFVSAHRYVQVDEDISNSPDIWKISTGSFLREKAFEARKRYEAVLAKGLKETSPVIHVDLPSKHSGSGGAVITACYRQGSTHSFLSSMTLLLQRNGLYAPRKYVESFANGFIAYSFHLNGLPEAQLREITNLAALNWILPRTTLSPMVELGMVDLPVVQWAYCGWKFAYHFLSRAPEEWLALYDGFKNDVNARAQLLKLKKRMHHEVITEQRISETIMENPEFISEMYADFKASFLPNLDSTSNQRPCFNESIWSRINKTVLCPVDLEIFRALLNFNAHILKTNFFKKQKNALSFRLDPAFLRGCDYPVIPYGVFLVVGAEFRGFHVRFDDVARGGIRLIRSRSKQVWQRNAEGLFDENYNLALTQTLKNKDIPESGSKGTVFLNVDHQDKDQIAFMKYIDSILDLILDTPDVVDYFGKPEILFFGPDEGTAGLMDWAALHARQRGYKFWSSVTTGKSQSLGGIPHDAYGMTTRGVHQYVLGITRKLGLKEEELTKVLTGGPDGDLGSNEIKISKDKTIAVVDGSGVLYDPNGINRDALLHLAKGREMVCKFDRSLLGPQGFLVLIDEVGVVLPNGTVVDNGMNFRNNFHLDPLASADLFVPCGGRPASVNLSNVDKLFIGPDRKPMFKYIVEGANLFFTQEARIKLEEAGVIIFKDASTNKGGVTSSSSEVLASLCMSDVEFGQLMSVKDGQTPEFYKRYVVDTENRIEANARAEFECLWAESMKPGAQHRCVLTDQLSERINQLNYQIRDSGLWDDERLVQRVLSEVIPPSLQEQLTLPKIFSRLPKSYVDATLSSYLAARYVYSHGLAANEFAFYQFMAQYRQ